MRAHIGSRIRHEKDNYGSGYETTATAWLGAVRRTRPESAAPRLDTTPAPYIGGIGRAFTGLLPRNSNVSLAFERHARPMPRIVTWFPRCSPTRRFAIWFRKTKRQGPSRPRENNSLRSGIGMGDRQNLRCSCLRACDFALLPHPQTTGCYIQSRTGGLQPAQHRPLDRI